VVQQGPLDEGVAEHGPFDAVILEGAVETLPRAIEAQLKVGGRIAAIFAEGAAGQARLGLRTPQGISWRRIFDATAPVLPGFAATKAFEF
jgi:protein-L-isoaspartate(D-aspartate) O-methyltransferase